MKLNDVFPSNYVKAADIKGREVPVVIAEAKMEKLGDDQKLVVYSQGKEKGLVCNKTNANRIAFLHGDDTDHWPGKEIVLAVEFVEFQGRTVEAIRIKPPQSRDKITDRGGYQLHET